MADKTSDEDFGPLTFGFDIGIASVGWAVLSNQRIIDLGVRCFDAAEDNKERITLNAKRRAARVSRNRYAQRQSRLKRLLNLFIDVGLLSKAECDELFSASKKRKGKSIADVWQLRAEAIDRQLSPTELARVVHHLVKWRGYGSLRDAADRLEASSDKDKADTGDSAAEEEGENRSPKPGKQLKFGDALDASDSRAERLIAKYRTIGAAVYTISRPNFSPPSLTEKRDAELFRAAFRNHADGYERTQLRKHLRMELTTIFERQRHPDIGSPYTNISIPGDLPAATSVAVGVRTNPVSRKFEDQVLALFDEQFPPIVEAQLEQLIGRCQLIPGDEHAPGELRAPKECFSSERSRWLQTLNRLKVRFNGDAKTERFLTPAERATLIDLPYCREKVAYKDLRDALCEKAGWPRDYRLGSFAPLSYRSTATPDSDQIFITDSEGTVKKLIDVVASALPKANKKAARAEKEKFKDWIQQTLTEQSRAGQEGSKLPIAKLRERLHLDGRSRFVIKRRRMTAILPADETREKLQFSNVAGSIFPDDWMLKIRDERTGKVVKLPAAAMHCLTQWSSSKAERTVGDLRAAVPASAWPESRWAFVIEEKQDIPPTLDEENATYLELTYTDAQKVEEEQVVQLKGWHKLKRALERQHPDLWLEFKTAWERPLSDPGLAAAKRIDQIFVALTTCFTDQEIEDSLRTKIFPALPEDAVAAVRDIVSSGFGSLSLKALEEIHPYLEDGDVYSKACERAGYDHSGARRKVAPEKFLRPLEKFLWKRISTKSGEIVWQERRYRDLANPVVARSFNQARRVLNSLIARYRSPDYVSIELARDLSKPGEERKRIDAENKQRANDKEKLKETFIKTYGVSDPSPQLMRKVRMREEQQCRCMYSEKEIKLNDLLSDAQDTYCQIDHILPRSRTADNSLDNQVLVLAGENQRKGDRTPFEWRGQSDPSWWNDFQGRVRSSALMSEKKKAKLLLQDLDQATEDEFVARNIVDTRYATRLFARMVREGLLFAGNERAVEEEISPEAAASERLDRFRRNRVRTPQGGVVAKLRGLWGLSKKREDGDLHHALDACVIAAATPKLIQRVNEYHRFEENVVIQSDGAAFWRETGARLSDLEFAQFTEREFPQPFAPHAFREEVLARLSPDGKTYWTKGGRKKTCAFGNYAPGAQATVMPVLVSRLVQRKVRSNELHGANPQALRKVSIPLKNLTSDMLDTARYPDQFIDPRRELFASLRNELALHDGNAESAFTNGHLTSGSHNRIHAISIPWLLLKPSERDALRHVLDEQIGTSASKNFKAGLKKVKLTDLTLEMLDEDVLIRTLGEHAYQRDVPLYQALRNALNKPGARAKEIFKDGFRRPDTSDEEVRKERIQKNPDYLPPLVKAIQLPAAANNGFYVRGGLVERGEPVVVNLYRHKLTRRYIFMPQYAMKGAHVIEDSESDIEIDNYEKVAALNKNDYLRIDHPSFIYCFRELHRWSDKDRVGNVRTFIQVEPIFPDKLFLGNFCHYEGSLGRPSLKLHDSSAFFLLKSGEAPLSPLVLLEREKVVVRKNRREKAEPEFDYVLHANQDIDSKKPAVFDFVTSIERKVDTAALIQQLHVDVLGRVANESEEK